MRNHAANALFLATALLALCATNTSAQVATAYDYTSIKPPNQKVGKLLELSEDTIAAAQITLLDLLTYAYDYQPDHIVGLTQEQLTTRFDVVAKIDPPGVSDPVHNPRAQTFLLDALLKNHFRLKAHQGMVSIDTGQLISLSSTKLTPSPPPPPRCPCPKTVKTTKAILTSDRVKDDYISMPALAVQLSKELKIQISDRTNLPGTYSIDLNWSTEALARLQPPGLFPPPSTLPIEQRVRQALQTQLGLMLVILSHQEKALIIDYVELPVIIEATRAATSSN